MTPVGDNAWLQSIRNQLPVHSTHRTPVGIPTTVPTAVIDNGTSRQHIIRLTDETTPHRRSRPAGVRNIEVWNAVSHVHSTPDKFTMVELLTRMRTTISYPADQIGNTAWYLFRYVNTTGERGPWSEVFTRMING